jgi:hypothetical protein
VPVVQPVAADAIVSHPATMSGPSPEPVHEPEVEEPFISPRRYRPHLRAGLRRRRHVAAKLQAEYSTVVESATVLEPAEHGKHSLSHARGERVTEDRDGGLELETYAEVDRHVATSV